MTEMLIKFRQKFTQNFLQKNRIYVCLRIVNPKKKKTNIANFYSEFITIRIPMVHEITFEHITLQ